MIKIIKLCIACVLFGLLLSIVSIVCGCASVGIRYTILLDENGKEVGREFAYDRTGEMEIGEFKVKINADGTKEIELGSSKGGSDFSESILNFSEAAKEVAKKIP